MSNTKARNYKHIGFLGFLGFLGFSYFTDHNLSSLFYFSFFSFFSYFFIGRLMTEMPDERYVINNDKARSKAIWIALCAVFIIGWSAGWPFGTKEFIVIVSALGWAATFIVYAIMFWYYEKH